MAWVYTIFALCVAYAVLGNLFVWIALVRMSVPLKCAWVGVPGYLYRRCVGANAGVALRRIAMSTNVALLVAAIALLFFMPLF